MHLDPRRCTPTGKIQRPSEGETLDPPSRLVPELPWKVGAPVGRLAGKTFLPLGLLLIDRGK